MFVYYFAMCLHSTIFAHVIQSFYNYIVTLPYPHFTSDHVHLLSDSTVVLFGWVHFPFAFVKKKLEDYFSFYTFFNSYTFHWFTFFHSSTFYSYNFDLYIFFRSYIFFHLYTFYLYTFFHLYSFFKLYTFHSHTVHLYSFHFYTFHPYALLIRTL